MLTSLFPHVITTRWNVMQFLSLGVPRALSLLLCLENIPFHLVNLIPSRRISFISSPSTCLIYFTRLRNLWHYCWLFNHIDCVIIIVFNSLQIIIQDLEPWSLNHCRLSFSVIHRCCEPCYGAPWPPWLLNNHPGPVLHHHRILCYWTITGPLIKLILSAFWNGGLLRALLEKFILKRNFWDG